MYAKTMTKQKYMLVAKLSLSHRSFERERLH